MPQMLDPAYFTSGIFAGAAPGELFQHYSCLECGARFKTFASFKAHRALNNCQSLEDEHADSGPAWARGEMTPADRAALVALAAQLPDAA